MAMGIVEVLQRHGHIDQDELIRVFERRYWADVNRGYGPKIHAIFKAIRRGVPWREAATAPAGGRESRELLAWLGERLGLATAPARGQGSLGNGGAMRVAPVGGYFADDFATVVAKAAASAEVTYAHPDGMAGAASVAVRHLPVVCSGASSATDWAFGYGAVWQRRLRLSPSGWLRAAASGTLFQSQSRVPRRWGQAFAVVLLPVRLCP
jgi:ADP-ribosylglycohydrolase